jgi:hypothetical protein
MKPENLNMEEITGARRKAIAASIRTIDLEELKALGERLFPFAGDHWRERFFEFLTENAGATFHHATTQDDIQVIYCNAKGSGVWFKPGVGLGLMQPQGLASLKQIVEGH